MLNNPVQFHSLYEATRQQLKKEEMQREEERAVVEAKKEQNQTLTVEHFDDISLFLINFAEKMYPCSEYINRPNSTREILTQVANGQLTP